MSEEDKKTEEEKPTEETHKEEESTATFEPVVSHVIRARSPLVLCA